MGKELVQESSLNALLEAFYNLDKEREGRYNCSVSRGS
jgi:hypothetical protein